ncbi:MAG: hypothetical protein K8S21_06565 [Gemmatimonadetes bacterium]|nr:hypothetical protein [Gemmatimonadota bacterium]
MLHRRVLIATAAALCAAASCAELGTGVGEVSYLAFDGIPWPALLAGDTLRDSLGVATPLRAHAFDASGREITGAPFRYFTLDTGVVVDSSGTMRATTRRDGTVRVVASLGALQSDDRLLRVTRRPDSTFAATAPAITLEYAIPDVSTNLSPEMRVSLVSRDTVRVSPGVGGWRVRWRTVHAGDTLAVSDTSWVALQTTGGVRSAVDTTAADGSSTRKLRVFVTRIPAPIDSFIVLADIRLYGARVPGSPVRFVVRVNPKP